MTIESPVKPPRNKSPKGMAPMSRIGLNLTLDERIAVEKMAAQDNRTVAAMSRVLVLRGLAAIQAEQVPPAPLS